jgi:abortive infection bacteriophage resistance protein
MRDYTKPSLTIEQQLELLKTRGLIIDDNDGAKNVLNQINYYRLSAYCLPFETQRDVFKAGVKFEHIRELYEFDRCLRFLIDEALEVVEISFRAKVAFSLSHTYGPFVHEKSEIFNTNKWFNHEMWLDKVHEEIERSKETFVQQYKYTYNGFPRIPIWMAVEVMSFGSISKMFQNLPKKDQIQISRQYNLNHRVLSSWLHTLSYIRNTCAHHSRLWNKNLSIAMELPNNGDWSGIDANSIISVFYGMNYMINNIPVDAEIIKEWKTEIEAYLQKQVPGINLLAAMGTDENFSKHKLWKLGA